MFRKKILLFVPISLLLSGCPSNPCRPNLFNDFSGFKFTASAVTPSGIQVDTGGFPVDLAILDSRIKNIVTCLGEVRKTFTKPDPKWQCMYDDPLLDTKCLKIKVVPPVYSKCSSWQFIGIRAPDSGCLAKGITPTADCPCLWRTGVISDYTVITPPAMYLWDVARSLTSCNGAWYSPYSKCMSF